MKKILVLITSVALAVSLSACTVPYTYITIAGNYVSDNKDKFTDQIDKFHEEAAEVINRSTRNKDLADYILRLLGADPEESGFEKPDTHTESSANINTDVPNNHALPEETSAPSDGNKPGQNTVSAAPEETTVPSDENKQEQNTDSTGSKEYAASSDNDKAEQNTKSAGSDEAEAPSASLIESPYIPEYVHIEKDDFEKLCKDFEQAGKENDEKQVKILYDELIDRLKNIYTMDTVAFLNFSVNVNEQYYDDEYTYTEKLITDCYDLFMLSCRSVYESEASKAFADCADPAVLEEAKDYEALTEEAKDLIDQETKLKNKYNTELDKIDSLSYELKGKTYTVADLYDDSSTLAMLSMFNYNDFIKVYEGLLKKINDQLGPIYVDLLQIRSKLADEYDYDSYADYCYENIFGRGYTTKEAEQYCEVIKKNIGPAFYQNAYYSIYNSNYFDTEIPTDKMFRILDDFTNGFDSFLNDSLHELMDKKLYDIGEGDGRYAGSYTTSVFTEQVPFIFINGKNDLSGLSTLEHEFGHFTNDLYEEKNPDYFFVEGNYDVMEIHSNSLQLLCSNHYSEIVDEKEAEEAKAYELAVQLSSVIDGCVYDEFQRKAYENPDLTLSELNDLYGKISSEYGLTSLPGNEYMWVLVNHSFESPMYYISYSISALSAMEIWTISQESEEKAIQTWIKVVKEADDEDYETVMKNAGLTPFTDSDGAVKICREVLDTF